MSVQLVGSRTDYEYGYGGYTGQQTDVGEIVATFDRRKDARLYIKNSRLKNPKDRTRPFKQKSLLVNFQYANIEEIEPHDPPPHNPKMPQPKRKVKKNG